MYFELDSKEDAEYLEEKADEVKPLTYGDEGRSVDIKLRCADHSLLVGERKTWLDFATCCRDERDRLHIQLSNVDFLVVEFMPPDLGSYPAGLTDEDHLNARKHLSTLTFQMPVLQTMSQEETWVRLEHLMRKGRSGLQVRENQMAFESSTTRERIFEAMPGVNPHREMESGETRFEQLERFTHWTDLVEALGVAHYDPTKEEWVPKWSQLPGIGAKTVQNILDSLLEGDE